jgi:DNA-binding transcriptional LysR family regulator
VDEAEQSVGQLQTLPKGVVRISTVVAFGRLHIVPRLAQFFASYPDIHVDVRMNDRVVDLVQEGVDVAFRMGKLPDSTLIAKTLCCSPMVTVATPAYLKSHGIPQHPRDLKEHDCVIYTDLARSYDIDYLEEGDPLRVRVDGPFLTNNTEAMRAALLSGLGIAKAPKWLVGDALNSGELVSVLDGYQTNPIDIHAVYPSGRHLPSKVRCLIDFFAEQYKQCDMIC